MDVAGVVHVDDGGAVGGRLARLADVSVTVGATSVIVVIVRCRGCVCGPTTRL